MLAILQDACDLDVKARLIPAGWIDKHRAVRARRSEASAEVLQSFGRSLRRRGPHSIQRLDVPSNTPCSLVGNHTETRTRANARCCTPTTYAPGLGSPPATSPRLSSCRAISDRDWAAAGRVQMAIGMGDAKGLYGYSIKSEVRPACPAEAVSLTEWAQERLMGVGSCRSSPARARNRPRRRRRSEALPSRTCKVTHLGLATGSMRRLLRELCIRLQQASEPQSRRLCSRCRE